MVVQEELVKQEIGNNLLNLLGFVKQREKKNQLQGMELVMALPVKGRR